jgi:hypothetical protein
VRGRRRGRRLQGREGRRLARLLGRALLLTALALALVALASFAGRW